MPSPTAAIFGRDKALAGMIHVAALPGTPRHAIPMPKIVQAAVDEARLLADAGFDSLLIENMHDAPYLRREVGPEIIAAMTIIACAVRRAVSVPLGIQILAGANHAALAVAHAADCQYIRAEGFVFASIADEGLIDQADAGPLLRYRKSISAHNIKILADIKKKHSSHAITADLDISHTAKAAEFFGADAIVITGLATGQAIQLNDLGTARVASALPLVVGSGVDPDSVPHLFAYADALIAGSWYKRDGLWSNPPCPDRVKLIARAVHAAR